MDRFIGGQANERTRHRPLDLRGVYGEASREAVAELLGGGPATASPLNLRLLMLLCTGTNRVPGFHCLYEAVQ